MKNVIPAEDRILIFMHIPKTGGMTLKRIIKRQYPDIKILKDITDGKTSEFKKIVSEKEIQFVFGHLSFGLHMHTSKPCTYVTMMREPIDRVISMYYYVIGKKDHPLHDIVKDLLIEEFIDHPDLKVHTNNMQTKRVLGKNSLSPSDLKQAKQNLEEHFSVIGITEMFDDSVALMKQKFNWNDISYVRKNQTKKRLSKEEIDPIIINKIKANNELDIQLYNWAKNRLVQELNSINASQ
ncbi:sulfotransferase family 2 domain-containing protein [Bacillus sp. CMF12]|uniref:sulfotransferase family 2 domain-containing protein n=1 Tax=Bacillaceae TaxID=186817 RepID=UPI001FB3199B|nr:MULTISPECIES: sulfotransferase family 2 domain-containing protein [Bacillaceae]UOE53086.1 sulfotransferase family 2 domain-containing protein [Cytobacillus oceanisediminis]USK52294.1 sulfotransferase family 2 domain-containing protein [Bacillus sp. CMF12]